jgi:hypothetical protein
VVAELGNEEILATIVRVGRKAVLAAVGRFHFRPFNLPARYVIALNPSTEIAFWNFVFFCASAHATSTPDALGDVD